MDLSDKPENSGSSVDNGKFQFPELVTSLLYASAVSNVLYMCINSPSLSVVIFLNTILVILLIFADWFNRILTPLSFPVEDQKNKQKPLVQLPKIFFEITSICCLVIFFLHFSNSDFPKEPNHVNRYTIFSAYLLMCFIWNFITLKIMKHLTSKDLFKGILMGNVFDIKGLNQYTRLYNDKIKADESSLIALEKNEGKKPKKNKKMKLWLKIVFARIASQFLANHIIWVNCLIAIYLIYMKFWGDISTPMFLQILPNFTNNEIFTLYLPMMLFSISVLTIKKYKATSGITFLIFLLLFYNLFNADVLIYIMIVQQIFVGILIQNLTQIKQINFAIVKH